ncbi:hypothetical protein CDAR_307941 [Caerostris darwini]|uniref:Uncharacterized protein n=1 Tax=Caerostris darwini TaxID=1538125 RepID=A0AAV4P912_9ARAC|nr:hypothetical protein CDAR_307941 [Caerostris darwini]
MSQSAGQLKHLGRRKRGQRTGRPGRPRGSIHSAATPACPNKTAVSGNGALGSREVTCLQGKGRNSHFLMSPRISAGHTALTFLTWGRETAHS